MPAVIMLTRLAPAAVTLASALEQLEREAMEWVRAACPGVEWMQGQAVLGPYDYLDIFRAPDVETATQVSTLFRTQSHAQTEIWPATEWARFKGLIRDLRPPDFWTLRRAKLMRASDMSVSGNRVG